MGSRIILETAAFPRCCSATHAGSVRISTLTMQSSHAQIKFVLLLSRQGKVRLSKWYTTLTQKERAKVIREITPMVLARPLKLCNFLDWKDNKARQATLQQSEGIPSWRLNCQLHGTRKRVGSHRLRPSCVGHSCVGRKHKLSRRPCLEAAAVPLICGVVYCAAGIQAVCEPVLRSRHRGGRQRADHAGSHPPLC